MKLKVLLPLGLIVAIVAATAATITVIVVHSGATSTAVGGGLPTSEVIDLNHFTPAPTTPQPSRGAATLTADDAIRVLTELQLQPGESITPGSIHATLESFGALNSDFNALKSQSFRYASDYPVWVVTASGTFTPLATSRLPGAGPERYTQSTYFIDGYSGAIISQTLVGATPTAGQRPSAAPLLDAPVIDAATATQNVLNAVASEIQSNTVRAVLTTFGAAAPVSITTHYVSTYPVWIVTADAVPAYQVDGKPTTMTLYVDGYSGVVLVTVTSFTPTATPSP